MNVYISETVSASYTEFCDNTGSIFRFVLEFSHASAAHIN